ncbi:MAG: hypothetical protein ACOYT8_01700 [Candidatus Dependentiae bacterium]
MKVSNFFTGIAPLLTFVVLFLCPYFLFVFKGVHTKILWDQDQLSQDYLKTISTHLKTTTKIFDFKKNNFVEINDMAMRFLNNGTTEIRLVADEPVVNLGNRWIVTKRAILKDINSYIAYKNIPFIQLAEDIAPSQCFVEWLTHIPTSIFEQFTLTYFNDFFIKLTPKKNSLFTITCSCHIPLYEETIFNCLNIEKQLLKKTPSREYLNADVRFENQIIIKKNKKGVFYG